MTTPHNAPCTAQQELFDANNLTPRYYEAAINEHKKQELRKLAETVDNTAEAITACSHCPLLALCREEVVRNIEEGTPPSEVVQAGIYWGSDSRPDFTLNGCLTRKSAIAAQQASNHCPQEATRVDNEGQEWPMTVPVYENSAEEKCCEHLLSGPIHYDLAPWDTSWVPAIPEPIDKLAVDLVCSTEGIERTGVPYSRLMRKNSIDCEGQEVLTDSEVCEVLRRLSEKGATTRFIADRIALNYRTVKKMMIRLGLPVLESESHSRGAFVRERRKAVKLEEQQKRIQSLVTNSKEAWDSTDAGKQIDLLTAIFDAEMART